MTSPVVNLAEILRHDKNFQSIMINMLQTALELSFDGVMITEAGSGYPIVYVNPALCAMTGYGFSELLGKSPSLLQGPQTDQRVLDDLRQKLDDGEPFHGQAINYRKNGSTFLMEWKIVPIKNEGGSISHFLAIQREIGDKGPRFKAPDPQLRHEV
jgi:PAS domain S-box-containing protein